MELALIISDVVGAFVVLWFFLTAEKERQNAAVWVIAGVIGYVLTLMFAMGFCRQSLKLGPIPGIFMSMIAAIAICLVIWQVLLRALPSGRGRGAREPGALVWSLGHIAAFAVLGVVVVVKHETDWSMFLFAKYLFFMLPAFCLCDGWRLRKPVTSLWVCALAAAVFWLGALAGLGKGADKGEILMAMLVTGGIAAAVGGMSGWIAVTRD